jgi:hypothetical protein
MDYIGNNELIDGGAVAVTCALTRGACTFSMKWYRAGLCVSCDDTQLTLEIDLIAFAVPGTLLACNWRLH